MLKIVFCLSLLYMSYPVLSHDKEFVINDIRISGNKKTKENIILRELTFRKGDSILTSRLENHISRSRENLLNTSLFNYVTITSNRISGDTIEFSIRVEERWYFWPALIFKYADRNFSAWLKARDLTKTKYGFSVDKFNFLGKRQNLRVSFLFGYARQFEISYRNIALDRNRRHFLGMMAESSKQDEMIINTQNNEPLLFKSNFQPVFEKNKYTLNYTFRPLLNDFHNVFFNYVEYNVSDTILKLNPVFLGRNISSMKGLNVDYVFSKDMRDLKAYPLKGYYFEILVGQTLSLPLSKSSFSSTVLLPNFFKYIEISDKLHYASNLTLKLSFISAESYYFSRSLGYVYNLHGFEYNTIEGQHFIVFKNLLKYTLLKRRVTEIKFLPFPKFNKIHYSAYFNVFADCGYVSNKYESTGNTYSNKFLYSAGVGLDLVTYYDRTFRAEYSVNGFGKGGFYLHLTAPINK